MRVKHSLWPDGGRDTAIYPTRNSGQNTITATVSASKHDYLRIIAMRHLEVFQKRPGDIVVKLLIYTGKKQNGRVTKTSGRATVGRGCKVRYARIHYYSRVGPWYAPVSEPRTLPHGSRCLRCFQFRRLSVKQFRNPPQ